MPKAALHSSYSQQGSRPKADLCAQPAHSLTAWVGVGFVCVWGGGGWGGWVLDFCINVINSTRQVCKVVDSPFVFIHADDDMGEVV